jgi:hypothetical protein
MTEPLEDQSTPDLVRLASTQIAELVRDELSLARTEMVTKARHAGTGAGLFGAAGVLAGYGAGALLVCVGLALAEVVAGWLAALIVAVVVLALAGLLAVRGRASLRRAMPPVPVQAARGLRADVAEVADAFDRGGQR